MRSPVGGDRGAAYGPAPDERTLRDREAMRIGLVVSLAIAGVQAYLSVVSELDAVFELVLKAAAAGAAVGASWRWAIGPGYRGIRRSFHWTQHKLELIGEVFGELGEVRKDVESLRKDVARVQARLEDGDERFDQVDQVLEVLRDEHTLEVQAAIRERRPVRLLPDGAPDRRQAPPPDAQAS